MTNEPVRRAKAAPPPSNDVFEYVMSDTTLDRMGDVIEQDWDLRNFRKHSPALFNHDRNQYIGEWENVRVENNKLIGKLRLAAAGTSELVDTVRKFISQGMMRAVSVGFKPIKYEKLNEDASEFMGPFRFLKSELLECSLVSVPANPNALQIARAFDVPRSMVETVLREPAIESRFQPVTGKTAKSIEVTRTVMTTLAQRIEGAQVNLTALRDRLSEIAGKETQTPEEITRADELPNEIEQAKVQLESLMRQERALSTSAPIVLRQSGEAEPARPAQQVEILEPRKPFALAAVGKKKIEPGDYLFRSLAAWATSQGTREPLEKTLRDRYGSDEITGMILRAAVNPAMTSVAGWAAELAQTVNVDFLDRLIPNAIYPQLAAAGVRYSFGSNAKLQIPTRTSSNLLSGTWVGEGAPKPVRRASFSSVPLTPFKLAVISTFTEEMATYSTPAIEGIIRQAMQDDTSVSMDTYLIDNNASSTSRPAGLLFNVTPIAASAATPATVAMVADLKALIAAIVAAGGGKNILILLNPAQAMALVFAQTTTGDFMFTNLNEAGARLNVRFVVSQTVPAGKVIAVDGGEFATANGDTPRFAVSNEATLHEEDTTPLALSATGTPNTVAAPMRSLFQTDAIAIRMTLYVSWTMLRTGMVQTITSVSW